MARILVADDVAENRYLLVSLLQGNGHEVVAVANGAAALAHAEGSPPDLIVTDILMPVMDGFELCRRWKLDERLRRIPFVIYTATYTDPSDERLALSLGADRFLVKPQKPEVLVETVREVLEEIGRGAATARPGPSGDGAEALRAHADALTRKLEKKVVALEAEVARCARVEQTLRENAALLRMAGRMARLGAWNADLAERRMVWSDEVAAVHEVPEGGSRSIEEGLAFYAPEWSAQIRDAFDACARDGTPFDEEAEIVTARGRRLWVRTIGEAIRDASGAVAKVQGAFQDITDRKRAEEERERLRSGLLQSQKIESIGRLAGGIAHDFNNLLSVVLSYARLAAESVREGDPLREDLEEIRKAGERAAALTRQLLAFSRTQLLEPRVLRLDAVVAGVEGMLRRLLGEYVAIEVRRGAALDGVMADPGQIDMVIVNLAINARDAMPRGGRLIIETANAVLDEQYAARHVGVAPGRYVMLSVTDTGIGMDAATEERIFEPFFTTKEKGTGLGLATVHGIVRQSGGNVCVYSEPGRGTTFKVYLPAVAAAAAETGSEPAPVVAGTGSETVLVVEDEDAVRKIAERILRSAGYRVRAAANGGEALLVCEKLGGEIDLLLTDVVMPSMSGRELAERLARTNPELKVLYMSGYAGGAISDGGVLEPGMRFIGKPFAAADLTRKVREALDQR